jgi:hypothetical protein
VLPGAVIAGLLVSAGLFAAAALTGGEIRHTEIRAGQGPAAAVERARPD